TWRNHRNSELRREDALAWANESITELQVLRLLVDPTIVTLPEPAKLARLAEIAIRTSVLVERGRLFFRNEVNDAHGQEKRSAYRGYGPRTLARRVRAPQIAWRGPAATADDRQRMALVAVDSVQEFVSLTQDEVGRERTASKYTKKGGEGINVRW